MGKKIKEIIWTAPAKHDLQTIYDYYFEAASWRTAENIINGVLDKIEILSQHSEIGQREILLMYKTESYHYLVQGNYKVIYRVKEEAIIIDAIFDCRQNPVKMGNL